MAKKTSEFTLVTTLDDSDTLTGVKGGVSDIQVSSASLKQKMTAIADVGGYFATDTVEAALQQLGAAIAGISVQYQPNDADLSAIAALTTTSFGRGLLTVTDGNMMLSTIGAQPVDSDLTAIAALTTTSFGRSLLTQANAAAVLSLIGAQPSNPNLTTIAGSTATAYGISLLGQADAAAARTTLGAAPTANPTFTGNVVVPDADAPTEAVSKQQMDTALTSKVDKAAMTTDGDLLTRSGGNPTRITRAGLASDPAFTNAFAAFGTSGPMGPQGPQGNPGTPAAIVVKSTTPTAADYGQASIPLNAIWVVSP